MPETTAAEIEVGRQAPPTAASLPASGGCACSDVGVVNGVSELHVENAGTEQRSTVRYLAVYARSGGAWRMIAWQSTRAPDA